jgi:hypothetical protein
MLQRRLPNTRLGEESTAQDEGCLQVSGAPPPSASRHPIGRPDALNAPISLGGVNASGQAPVVIGSACLVSILVTVLLRLTRTAPACRLWPRRRRHAPGCLRARRDMSTLRQLASDHISPLGNRRWSPRPVRLGTSSFRMSSTRRVGLFGPEVGRRVRHACLRSSRC